MEIYKSISGFESYQVSNMGNVKSLMFKKERILKPFRVGNYLGVWLGKGHKKYIHHLVADAFIITEKKSNYQIDHINKDTKDNRVENLRYVPAHLNQINKVKTPSHISKHKLSGFTVRVYRNGKYILCKWCATYEEAEKILKDFIEANHALYAGTVEG